MDYTRLGRTELNVSVAGLGCGGRSKLGIKNYLGERNAKKIIRKAFDLGVNFFDTAAVYSTEEVLGKALKGINRDNYVLSTKFSATNFGENLLEEGSLIESLNKSLKKLRTDHIDVFLFHGVRPSHYIETRDRFYPELIRAKEQGKILFTGLSEYFNKDTGHEMAKAALKDNLWDVLMVGYNLLNSSARKEILPLCLKYDVGTLDMFAVRTALSRKQRLLEVVEDLIMNDEIDSSLINQEDPLDFLVSEIGVKTVIDAAYRFCRHSEGIDVVLTGTSSVGHLVDNIASISSPPLSEKLLEKIIDVFGEVDSVSGE